MTPQNEDGEPQQTLFEISWEVAHRVGGIHTVVSTKARELAKRFGDRHVVLGPWLRDQHDPDAVLDPVGDSEGFETFVEDCRHMGVPVRVGRWRVPGNPLTILVEFSGLFARKDEILTELWEEHGVDSLFGDWGYIEPVMFGHAAGMVIERLRNEPRFENTHAVVQSHEWMTGAALLYLSRHAPEMGSVFTTHATVLGRAAGSRGRFGETVLGGKTPEEVAKELDVRARHSLESISARTADVFTTVSDLCAGETEPFLGRATDVVLPNGYDAEVMRERLGGVTPDDARARLHDLASRFLGADIGDSAILAAGGRYEFHNKGYDVLIDAAAAMNDAPKQKGQSGRDVVLFLLVPAGNSGLRKVLADRLAADEATNNAPIGIATHNLFDPDTDAILTRCKERGLDNAHGSRVRVIFWADYVAPDDGVLGLRYEAVVQGADATAFPSYYESWGYTPQESLALGAPTITSDHAGFGLWARANDFGPADGVHVLPRAGRPEDDIVTDLAATLERLVENTDGATHERCTAVAAATEWSALVRHHLRAIEMATDAAERRNRERPEALAGLTALADNWWWTTDPEAAALFAEIDPELWRATHHAPVRLLHEASTKRLEELAADAGYTQRIAAVLERFRAHMDAPAASSSGSNADGSKITPEHPVAYLCAEFGLHESFPVYSGGLGVLAGDHLRAASDERLPLVGVGLLYRQGYMRQRLLGGAVQLAEPEHVEPAHLPLHEVRDDDGKPVTITIDFPGSDSEGGAPRFRIWRTQVGRVPLYLLDADLPGNSAEDRELTRALYSGDEEMRIRQEIVLGIGGARLLRAIGIEPSVYHINEGHGAFVGPERMRHLMRTEGLTIREARDAVRANTVFTTHTPVPAGHDEFSEDLMRRYFGDTAQSEGVPWEQFMRAGAPNDAPDRFNMTALALRLAAKTNGVSKKHGEVSRELLRRFDRSDDNSGIDVHHITNGVHLGAWTQAEMRPFHGEGADDATLWTARSALRDRLRDELFRHLRTTLTAGNEPLDVLDAAEQHFTPDALVIGFARRFATYKRAGLIFSDPDRLHRLLSDPDRPVRILIAGKAHPRDSEAQNWIGHIGRLAREPRFLGRIVLVENYDIGVARWLVAGCDVWLNNPRPPLEASGTSGMKSAANGGLNLSIGDGWWLEAADGKNGWTIGTPEPATDDAQQDEADRESLYTLLETEVVPEFFDRDADGHPAEWLERVRAALITIPPVFDARRMVREYQDRAYDHATRT